MADGFLCAALALGECVGLRFCALRTAFFFAGFAEASCRFIFGFAGFVDLAAFVRAGFLERFFLGWAFFFLVFFLAAIGAVYHRFRREVSGPRRRRQILRAREN